ncbi:MAG TPA: cupredoxin domain-containing protein [Thermomicrobiales bacterium]|nr:cupredoxin domain-containing protein [Thermomicrobiales bacterium]
MSSFDPGEVTIPANTDVTLRLVNEGEATHNLTIDGAGIVSDMVEGGEAIELVVNLPPGTYSIGCDVPGHRIAGMTGVLHVVD